MFNQKLNKERIAEMGRHAEESLSRNCIYTTPGAVGTFIPDNEQVAQELINLANLQQAQGPMRDLLLVAAARLVANNVVMREPNLEHSEVYGQLLHLRAEQVASSAVVQHHYEDRHKHVHVVLCDQEGNIKSRQILGEAASAEWLEKNVRNGRR